MEIAPEIMNELVALDLPQEKFGRLIEILAAIGSKKKRLPGKKPSELPEEEAKRESLFAEFWLAYPDRARISKGCYPNPKKAAREIFVSALKRGVDATVIISRARVYATRCELDNTDPRFIPMARTWLHQCRWQDECSIAPSNDRQQRRGGFLGALEESLGYGNDESTEQDGFTGPAFDASANEPAI